MQKAALDQIGELGGGGGQTNNCYTETSIFSSQFLAKISHYVVAGIPDRVSMALALLFAELIRFSASGELRCAESCADDIHAILM